jgi:glyoxylase-like metal-dependent hydrolase (beta-lactamase superfamily II)/rhodanese-related sulfurtransferase
MILQQFYLNCLAHASYLVGEERSGAAAVIDPQRDIDQYLTAAEAKGLRIEHVILTHFHADFVAGHLELRERTGATIHLGAAAKAEYAFHPLRDGSSIDLGRVRLTAIETPGHTVESISIAVSDLHSDRPQPAAVLTGDTLFVGDVGRPDLRVALGWSAAELGGMLYHSLHAKLLGLPDTTLLYPAHGAGSLCGKALSQETVSTIGEQRRSNYALQPMSKAMFIDLVIADQPDAPPYFTYDAVLNSQERDTLKQALQRELVPLALDRVLAEQARGAQILDTRDATLFAAAHLSGSINIGLNGQYATWAGTVLTRERPIVIIADPGAETESAVRLGRIGFDNILGYLSGGLEAAHDRLDVVRTTNRFAADAAAEQLTSASPPVMLDVRTDRERREKAIAGSLHVPLSALTSRFSEIPSGRPVLVYCAGGYRSSIAASLLQREGFSDVGELAGGIGAWQTAGLSVRTA